jgi:pimeloyl-ACP methyl ester carboxylesterase
MNNYSYSRNIPKLKLPLLLNFGFFLILVSPVIAATQIERTNYNDGQIVGYLEYLPEGYSQTEEKYPLIIYLHGLGERAGGGPADLSKVAQSGIPELIKNGFSLPFIVISPQVRHTWNGKGGHLDAFLDYLLVRYPGIDPERVYFTGISDGGKGVFDMAMYHRDRVAAIIPVSTWPSDGASVPLPREPFSTPPGMPIWGFMGDSDSFQAMDNWLNALAPESTAETHFTLMKGGHTGSVWNTVFAGASHQIYDWLLSHRRPQAVAGYSPTSDKPEIIALETFVFSEGATTLQNQSGDESFGWNSFWIQPNSTSQEENQVLAHRYLGTILGKRGGVWVSVDIQSASASEANPVGLSLTNDLRQEGLFIGVTSSGENLTLKGDALKSPNITMPNPKPGETIRLVLWLDFGRNEGVFWADPGNDGNMPFGQGKPFSLFPGKEFDRIVLYAHQRTNPVRVLERIVIATTYPLVDAGTPMWAQWAVTPQGYVNTDHPSPFLGWLQVTLAPYVWAESLNTWMYLPETNIQETGSWSFIFGKF